MVLFIQFTTLYLIYLFFIEKIVLTVPEDFLIMVPRLISSFHLHLTIGADIRDGLQIMKYVANHPLFFRRPLTKAQKERINYSDKRLDGETENDIRYEGLYWRVFYAFFIGFCQCTVAMVLEVLSIIYITQRSGYIFILVVYGTLATITTFDNMFAKALAEHPIKKTKGKFLKVTFRRWMLNS